MTQTQRPSIAFAGTPDEAATVLDALHAAEFDIEVVLTVPDARRGRGSATSPTAVKAKALDLGLRVTHDIADLSECGADLGVVVAYGYLIPLAVLERLPMINLHFSLLPRWRGAAPVERAILAGDKETGVCVMEVAEALDSGGVFACKATPIGQKTALELRSELTSLGAELLVETLTEGLGVATEQQGEPTYAAKIAGDDRYFDAETDPVQAERIVRIGGAWTIVGGKRVKVHDAILPDASEESAGNDRADSSDSSDNFESPAETAGDVFWVALGAGELGLATVQPEGKKPMTGRQWANGARLIEHERMAP